MVVKFLIEVPDLPQKLQYESVMPSRSSVIVVDSQYADRLNRKEYLVGEHEHNDSVGAGESVDGATEGDVVGGGVLK